MLLAQEVLHAYTMISISIMVVFTSLREKAGMKNMNESDTPGASTWLHVNGVSVCWTNLMATTIDIYRT